MVWAFVNIAGDETYTRLRYREGFKEAISAYYWMEKTAELSSFTDGDRLEACNLLIKHQEAKISYNDALIAAVMMRKSSYRIFTFDNDFRLFGVEVLPGYF